MLGRLCNWFRERTASYKIVPRVIEYHRDVIAETGVVWPTVLARGAASPGDLRLFPGTVVYSLYHSLPEHWFDRYWSHLDDYVSLEHAKAAADKHRKQEQAKREKDLVKKNVTYLS